MTEVNAEVCDSRKEQKEKKRKFLEKFLGNSFGINFYVVVVVVVAIVIFFFLVEELIGFS